MAGEMPGGHDLEGKKVYILVDRLGVMWVHSSMEKAIKALNSYAEMVKRSGYIAETNYEELCVVAYQQDSMRTTCQYFGARIVEEHII